MKILLATDGSPLSEPALDALCKRPWSEPLIVKVLGVVHTHIPPFADPFLVTTAAHFDALEFEGKRLEKVVHAAAQRIRAAHPTAEVLGDVLKGSPKKVIVEQAEAWEADLILVGFHGHGPVKRFLLGSVAHAVVMHANCPVEVVRTPMK